MPLGFERLNERVKRPNDLINFIRPLPGRDEARSQDFLERVAAIVYPIMKANTIAVMALEEFPPNREFWGRNFNAGEVIQLVLRAQNGSWLPFRQVQMVMIHELAHCKQMNHSKFFWGVRNAYAGELRMLWQKHYTGEGLWGAGRGLDTGAYITDAMPDAALVPAALCGGVYRRRGKRKRKGKTNEEEDSEVRRAIRAEQKEKRILKKFGPGGLSLGADEEERNRLEQGSRSKAKGRSRVAGSNRARELRAAAALARFEQAKPKKEEAEDEFSGFEFEAGSETESDAEHEDADWSEVKVKAEESERLQLDAGGDHLVKVCSEEDLNDENVKQEQKEFLLTDWLESKKVNEAAPSSFKLPDNRSKKAKQTDTSKPAPTKKKSPLDELLAKSNAHLSSTLAPLSTACTVCSCDNEPEAILCAACSNVLRPDVMRNHWRCQSDACSGGSYVNAGDYGRCQICGSRKPE